MHDVYMPLPYRVVAREAAPKKQGMGGKGKIDLCDLEDRKCLPNRRGSQVLAVPKKPRITTPLRAAYLLHELSVYIVQISNPLCISYCS
jgi:hypothetical protein